MALDCGLPLSVCCAKYALEASHQFSNDNADHPLEWCAGKCTNDGGDNPTGDPGKDGKSMSTTIVLNKEYSLSFNHAAPRDVTLRLQYSDVFKVFSMPGAAGVLNLCPPVLTPTTLRYTA